MMPSNERGKKGMKEEIQIARVSSMSLNLQRSQRRAQESGTHNDI